MLSGSQKPPGTYTQICATRCDSQGNPGHEDVDVRQNISHKRIQRVEKPPGTIKFAQQALIQEEIISWASACRRTPK